MGVSAAVPGIEDAEDRRVAVRIAACRMLLRLENEVVKELGSALAAPPYWGLLVATYLAELEGRTIFQSCLTTEETGSNHHRRSARLEQLGALIREPDPHDHRRTDLRLTQSTRSALDRAIEAVLAVIGQTGEEIGLTRLDPSDLIQARHIWYHQVSSTKIGRNEMNIVKGKVIAGGRIALPADIRRSLGLENGDTVLFELEGDQVKIRPARSALRRVQDRLQAFAPKEGLVSEELIAERRAEASRD